MRAQEDPEFSQFLEETGQGNNNSYTVINKPELMLHSEEAVLESIYGREKINDEDHLYNSCVLVTLNKEAHRINNKVSEKKKVCKTTTSQVLIRLSGEEKVYESIDLPKEGEGIQLAPEFLHECMPSGMPPHRLCLKVNATNNDY